MASSTRPWEVIPGPPLESIADSNARLNIWHGPVRSSKTVSSLVRWVGFVRDSPPGPLAMVGKTELTLQRNVLAPLQAAFGSKAIVFSTGQHKAWIYGRDIDLFGANDSKAVGKIQGATLAGAYGDELALWPEEFFKMLQSRLSIRGAKLFGTTNPDGPYHWLKVGLLDRQDLDLRKFTWPIDANTTLDPEFVESLKKEYVPGSLWYRRFIEGQWVAAEGAVYDFFNEAEHVIPKLLTDPERLFLSIDYGTSNATSAGLYGAWRQGPLKAARLRGYYYDGRATGRQKTDSDYADDLDSEFGDVKSSIERVIVDPSAASFKAELRKRGWRTMDANNDVIDGIRTQAKMLKSGEYKIVRHQSNMQAIRDYGAYLWDSKAQARGEDKPLKQHDHTKDEERYLLHTVFVANRVTSATTANKLYR